MVAQNQEITYLKAQLAEKDTIVKSLQSQVAQAGRAPGTSSESGDLAKADRLVKVLTRTVAAQQKVVEKQRDEADRLARELHALAAGIQMLGQSLSDEASQMATALSGEK